MDEILTSLIMGAIVKHCYTTMPKLTPEGRNVARPPKALVLLLAACFFGFSLLAYFLFVDGGKPRTYDAGTLAGILVFTLLDGLFFFLAMGYMSRIEYDGTAISCYNAIGNKKSINWADVVSIKYTFMGDMEIRAADRTKISFSYLYEGFNHLVNELKRRVQYEKRAGACEKMGKRVEQYIGG